MKRRGVLITLCAVGVLVIAAAVALFVHLSSGYRTIQLYQLDGEAELLRSSRPVEPYVGMMLRSEDHVSTMEESYLYLKMDDDKYMLAEPETRFTIIAKGSAENSKTTIKLEIGAVVNHITAPLSSQSSYEVTTPNSTMAVRGTSFRVYVWFDELGVSHTMLQVFEGIVEVHLLYPDGSISEEARRFTAGQTVTIWGDSETSDYDRVEGEIDYYALEIPTLEFLKIGINGLETYDISIPEVEEIIRIKQSFYTVNFKVGNRIFASQSIQWGKTAHIPELRPALSGSWDFNFEKKIYEDTDVFWSYAGQ